MHNEEVETFIFILFIQTLVILFYKLLTQIIFSVSIGCLIEGLSYLCQNMHTRISEYGVLVLI